MSTETLHLDNSALANVGGGSGFWDGLNFTNLLGSVGNVATGVLGALNNPQTPVQTTPGTNPNPTVNLNLPAGYNSTNPAQSGFPVLLIAGIGAVGIIAAIVLMKGK